MILSHMKKNEKKYMQLDLLIENQWQWINYGWRGFPKNPQNDIWVINALNEKSNSNELSMTHWRRQSEDGPRVELFPQIKDIILC